MIRKIVSVAGVLSLAAMPVLADFSYQETTTITGGALVAAMKVAAVFSRDARKLREPITSTVAVKGDRMVHRSPTQANVIDLAAQTITSIDLEKKTYSVITFAELKEVMEQASQRMAQEQQKSGSKSAGQSQDPQVDAKLKVNANATGKSKQIAGIEAKELVLTMRLEATDKQSGQSGAMVMIADTWVAPKVQGYDEYLGFMRRMAEKLQWTPGGNMFMNRPDLAQGMSEIQKETAKLDGIPIFQTTVMGPEGTAPVDRSDKPPSAEPAKQSQGPSVRGALGGALGGRFGLGKKKAEEPPPAASAEGGDPAAAGLLIEMTSETKGFSSASVDASLFEIPSGFKKVDSELRKMK
jgi:hypothetical protein